MNEKKSESKIFLFQSMKSERIGSFVYEQSKLDDEN